MSNEPKVYEVLIVDDISENLQLLGSILSASGYDVSFANSGMQALEAIDYAAPDLILLDISMPVMNGFEVCERIKANPLTAEIPVIFLTAMTNSENIVKGFRKGGVDYITKPFNSEELLARVKTHIELKEKKEQIKKYAIQLSALNKDLNDSIAYAHVIQSAIWPSSNKIQSIFPDSFVFHKPKHQLSGDFLFIEKVNGVPLAIVADCTGHGVPGALLAMMGNSMLNQIINHDKVIDPAEIQFLLNNEFIRTFTGKYVENKHAVGMDLSICGVDEDGRRIWFSGKRPIYVLRDETLIKLDGNTQSIGGYSTETDKKFITKEFSTQSGDKIFMFSDGFADQFGGEHNKKFTTKRFKDLIVKYAEKSLDFMGLALQEELTSWMKDNEQVDDILVAGFKIY
jgi:phosphoserine phosphatase RsbU/P